MKQKKPPIKPRSKKCDFCKTKTEPVWSDNVKLLDYLTARGRIMTSKFTGVCVKHQKRMAVEIKRARHLALVPFTNQE
jgi:small subunit ribosomal protein S18